LKNTFQNDQCFNNSDSNKIWLSTGNILMTALRDYRSIREIDYFESGGHCTIAGSSGCGALMTSVRGYKLPIETELLFFSKIKSRRDVINIARIHTRYNPDGVILVTIPSGNAGHKSKMVTIRNRVQYQNSPAPQIAVSGYRYLPWLFLLTGPGQIFQHSMKPLLNQQ
jgi:hypothetical protein